MIKRKPSIKITEKDIVIRLPIALMVHAIKNKPEFPLRITDRKAFTEYIKDNLFEFEEDSGRSDVGSIFHIIEEMVDEAFENGEEWLEEIVDEDE